jgi:hypothetical protein
LPQSHTAAGHRGKMPLPWPYWWRLPSTFGCGGPSLRFASRGRRGRCVRGGASPSPAHTLGLSASITAPYTVSLAISSIPWPGKFGAPGVHVDPDFRFVEAKKISPRTKSTACNFATYLLDPTQAQRPRLLTYNNPFRLQIELNRFCPPTCPCSAWKQVLG